MPTSEDRRLRREARANAIIKTIGGKWRKAAPPVKLQPTRLPGTNAEPNGFVYFVYCAGRIKIGFASNIATRMYTLATGAPFPATLLMTIAGTMEDEEGYHQLFRVDRAHLEWFLLSERLRAFLEEKLDTGGRAILEKAEDQGMDILLCGAGDAIERGHDVSPLPALLVQS